MKTCKKCRVEKAEDRFVTEPSAQTNNVCLDCLPKSANGFSQCKRCGQRKIGEQFKERANGRRTRLCLECYPREMTHWRCEKCQTEKPIEQFPHHLQPGGGKRRLHECVACYRPKTKSRICNRCRERVAEEEFAVRSYYSAERQRNVCRRDNICKECAKKKLLEQKTCCACKEKKPIEKFRKILWQDRSRRCLDCPVPRNYGKGGALLRKLDQNCLQCGEEIWTYHPPNRTKDAKYCSRTCSDAARLPDERECNQCRQTLPASEFPAKSCNKAHALWRCNLCLQDIREGRLIARPGSCTPTSLMRQFRLTAKRTGKELQVRYREVRNLLLQPCAFCGGEADTVAIAEPAAAIAQSNLRPMCLICRRFVGRHTVAAMERFCLAAAAAKPAPIKKRPPSRPKLSPAAKLKRCDKVPPEVHGAPIVGETWEEKLARHARPKGPFGGKKKAEEQHV